MRLARLRLFLGGVIFWILF